MRKDFLILLKLNGMTLGMWNKFFAMFKKSNLDSEDKKFYDDCLHKIIDIRIKYNLKGIQVKEIENLFQGIKEVAPPIKVSRAEYEKRRVL